MEISPSSIISVSEENVYCNIEDEIVILDLGEGIYYGLNPVGARIWDLIQKPKKVSDILEILLDEYDVEEEECKSDLIELLEQLSLKKLIKIK